MGGRATIKNIFHIFCLSHLSIQCLLVSSLDSTETTMDNLHPKMQGTNAWQQKHSMGLFRYSSYSVVSLVPEVSQENLSRRDETGTNSLRRGGNMDSGSIATVKISL
jgi:hypothetical protein